MTGQTHVDPAVLQSGAARYNSASNEIKGILGSLQGTASESAAHISGRAGTAFRGSAERFNHAVSNLNTTLDSVGNAIRSAGGKFDAQEQQAHAQLSKLPGDLFA